jgi:formate hydrogenlyase subunit 3/multisubunit Na+/H+ antiporter MnhD subunit
MISLFFFLFIAAIFVFIVPPRWKGAYTALVLSTGILITTYIGTRALFLSEPAIPFGELSLFNGFQGVLADRLSGFFILIINITSIVGILYALGYLRQYRARIHPIRDSIHYFSYVWLWASMILLTVLREGFAFLVVWEFMTLSSFLLVIYEGEERKTLKTGINYLIQMHIGFLFLMVAFLITGDQSGNIGFDALPAYFMSHNNLPVFLLFFIGFGIKAGFIPIHTWLPQAHPAAPSHVSGLMSGVMIKMGIFGILRVLSALQSDWLSIGLIILGISLVSGVLGVMMAIVQHDLKRLLAYHSIENIGIIGIGIGLGVVGIATGNPVMQVLGFSGGLLHVLSHSLFKSILFFSAGAVYSSTHSRNLDVLGGLIKRMPMTAVVFLIGSLAICGLPPFNGFISEYLIFSGLFKSLAGMDLYMSIIILVSIIGLALIGGLALFCFTKAFGMVFLGEPRSEAAAKATEVRSIMLIPQLLPIVLILFIGLGPALFVKPVMGIAGDLFGFQVSEQNTGLILADLGRISLIAGSFVIIALVLWWIRRVSTRNKEITYGPTWGCGFTAGNEKQQYTASSFADNFATLANPFLRIKKETEQIADNELFPNPKQFKTHVGDMIKRVVYDKPSGWFLSVLKKIAVMQTGQIQHYILYAFVFMILVFVLTFFNLI